MTKDLKPPIIFIDNTRSGTTLVQNLFDLHPEIVKWFEPRTLWMYADPGRNHDEFDEDDASEEVIKYIRSRFLKYQQENGELRVAEKTPHNVFKVPYVNKIFPVAKFLSTLFAIPSPILARAG